MSRVPLNARSALIGTLAQQSPDLRFTQADLLKFFLREWKRRRVGAAVVFGLMSLHLSEPLLQELFEKGLLRRRDKNARTPKFSTIVSARKLFLCRLRKRGILAQHGPTINGLAQRLTKFLKEK